MPIDFLRNKISTFFKTARSGVEELREQARGGSGAQQAINRFRRGFTSARDPISRALGGEFQEKFRPIVQGALPRTRQEAFKQGIFPVTDRSGRVVATVDPNFSAGIRRVGAKAIGGLFKLGNVRAKIAKRQGVRQDVSSIKSNTARKVVEALKKAKPLRAQQERVATQARKQRVARVAAVGERVGGEGGFFAQLGQLKGPLPKVQFRSIRQQFKQTDIDDMFNLVEGTDALLPLEKVTAKTGLSKLFGSEGGAVPTRNEIELMREVFGNQFAEEILKKRPFGEKLLHGVAEVLNVPRAIVTSADFSAPFRQGAFLIGRPKQFVPAFLDMFKFAFSEKAYQGFTQSMRRRPNFNLMKQSKLALTELDAPLTQREEAFMGQLAEKIPGVGVIVRGSNRAYTGFLNKLRADVFADLVSKADRLGIEMTDKGLRDTSRFINSATGRGDLGKVLGKAGPLWNALFFSPKLIASRLNMLNPVFYTSLDPFARKEALKSLLTFSATASTILGLANLNPKAEVGVDPRSADFGKIKVGNKRWDILAGFQQYIRLGAQLGTGTIISSTSGREITLGEGYKPLTRGSILARFAQQKFSPVASFVAGLIEGQTTIGEDFDIPEQVIERFIPMTSQDLYDLWQEDGLVGVLEWTPALFGTGVQTYGEQEVAFGEGRFGEQTAQIKPRQDLGEKIRQELLGPEPLGQSRGFSVETYYDQMSKLPREEAAEMFDRINEVNPNLADKISKVVKDREKGLTVKDKTLKSKGVANGDRAFAIEKELDKLKTPEEKAALWDDYTQKGVITDDVAQQLYILLAQ